MGYELASTGFATGMNSSSAIGEVEVGDILMFSYDVWAEEPGSLTPPFRGNGGGGQTFS